jgi:hypothetical protein
MAPNNGRHLLGREVPHWFLGSIMLVLFIGLVSLYFWPAPLVQYPGFDLVWFFTIPLAFLSSVAYLGFYRRMSRFFAFVAFLTVTATGALLAWITVLNFFSRVRE